MIKLIGSKGSLFTGRHSGKKEQIEEAVRDLELIFDGVSGKPSEYIPSIARACSIFLRKLILGDRRGPESRLLNTEFCESSRITFEKLRKIGGPRRTLAVLELKLESGSFHVTREEDGARQIIPLVPFEYSISLEWPLCGTQQVIEEVEEKGCLEIGSRKLFDENLKQKLSCQEWLAQPVVLVNDKGINLREIIRTVVNTEGAHTVGVVRMSNPITQKETSLSIPPEPHILNNISIFDVKFTHIIVIMTALYILKKVSKSDMTLTLNATNESFDLKGLMERSDRWLRYLGGGMIPLGHSREPIQEKYRIRSY